jgi:SRSO17 transposase
LKTGLGIDHFEGRNFTGWHRHVTLTVPAQAFCILLRLDSKANAPHPRPNLGRSTRVKGRAAGRGWT